MTETIDGSWKKLGMVCSSVPKSVCIMLAVELTGAVTDIYLPVRLFIFLKEKKKMLILSSLSCFHPCA